MAKKRNLAHSLRDCQGHGQGQGKVEGGGADFGTNSARGCKFRTRSDVRSPRIACTCVTKYYLRHYLRSLRRHLRTTRTAMVLKPVVAHVVAARGIVVAALLKILKSSFFHSLRWRTASMPRFT